MEATKQKRIEIAFSIAAGGWFFIWSIMKPLNSAPDEQMRYVIPLYIYKYGKLPMGNDPEVVNDLYGFSYAYLPTWAEPIIAALFMRIASFLFGTSDYVLLIAAPFVSVISMTLALYFILRTLDLLFDTETKWFIAFFIGAIPQFAFLASYINNDSLNVCGASVVLYACVSAIKNKWSICNSLFLAVGISIIAVSYYYGYGWIIGGGSSIFEIYWN